MDFLKTMLIYMSMTFALGVQQAPAPDPASLPTATPAPVVTEASSQVIATPAAEATVKPTKAAPAMTPNNRYGKLVHGDRNNNVKKLQQRLIELGYLSKGDADGAYGYKTMNAVRAFQRNNGLSVDGVAGKATQTYLYENKNVVAAATAVPTEKPTPKPETSVSSEIAAPTATEVPTSDLTATWRRTDANVLLNGESLVLLERSNGLTRQRRPGVFLHDGKVMISLNDMATASGEWSLASTDGKTCVLEIAGYKIELTSMRNTAGDSDSFTAKVDGSEISVSEGDIVYAAGTWYAGASFLESAVHADVVWDSDENTLVLRVVDKAMAGAAD